MNQLLLLFEILDKEPSLSFIWGFFLAMGIGGFFLTRKHPAFLLLVLLFVFAFASLIISEINAPYVGPDIIREAGRGYVVQSYIAITIGTVIPFFGVAVWLLERKRKTALKINEDKAA